MPDIKVAVNGILGRMGSTVAAAVQREQGMAMIGGVDSRLKAPSTDEEGIVSANTLHDLFVRTKPDVLVDFTNATGGELAMRACIDAGVRCVSGSTGIDDSTLADIGVKAWEAKVGVISASNFALGCVVLMHLAKTASAHFEYADIIESHHENKVDAPSGTALSIARAMADGRSGDFSQTETELELIDGTRGGTMAGINIHSARLPGRVARHEVVFGAEGQTLTLIHDSTSRESFMPGVMLAVRRVMNTDGLIVGLGPVIGLDV